MPGDPRKQTRVLDLAQELVDASGRRRLESADVPIENSEATVDILSDMRASFSERECLRGTHEASRIHLSCPYQTISLDYKNSLQYSLTSL